MRLSEDKIEKNDSLAILLNMIDGKMPQLNFHRLDLGDSVFRDTIEMGFFNCLFEEFIDVNDMEEDLMNKEFGADLKAFLTSPKGKNFKELDSNKTFITIDSLLQIKDDSQKAIFEKNMIENSKVNNGRIFIYFVPSRLVIPTMVIEPIQNVRLDSDQNVSDKQDDKQDDKKEQNVTQNIELTYTYKSNNPRWKKIKNAHRIIVNISSEGDISGLSSKPFELKQQLTGAAVQHSFGVQGGENSARTFQIQIQAYDINDKLLELSNNVLNGVKLSCTR
jgi:hypothetical protein